MASSTHRPTQSISTNLQPPGQTASLNTKQQRRMTSPAGSLALPDQGRRPSSRPPSPLRNGFILDTGTGIDPNEAEDSDDDDDDHGKWRRSPSPSSSASNLAASFVQRMNNFVGGIAPKSPTMLSDAELEAEAERERDRSRREAEVILTREAHQRQLVEERVLAMVESTRSLPPPPARSQTMPNPPSPANSQKETNWWTMAKNKLTPTKDKEPLTPAQKIIQDTRSKEKDKKKDKDWPSNAHSKFTDPAYANLNIPVTPPVRKPAPPSPSSPTPSRPSMSNMPPNLSPSPMRGSITTSSPSREAPPMYAQFNDQGTLDVPGTLLAIAKRFEKLEKWTVGHVRALEERMTDVEKYLVERVENEKTKEDKPHANSSATSELHDIRDEIAELQGRVGELGREMARMATASSKLSSGPTSQTASVSAALPTTSMIVEQTTGSSFTTPHHRRISASALESTSPPIASKKTPTGTRLPYPQGDYTSPPDAFSPPNSPPGSLNRRTQSQTMSQSQAQSISGLPNTASPPLGFTSHPSTASFSSNASYARATSPSPMSAPPLSGNSVARAVSPTPSTGSRYALPAPKQSQQRQSSVSPTPRKRYTVALGGPLVPPDEDTPIEAAESLQQKTDSIPKRSGTPRMFVRAQTSIDNFFAPKTDLTKKNNNDEEDDDDDDEFGGETIGKSAAARLSSSGTLPNTVRPGKGDYKPATLPPTTSNATSGTSPSPMSNRRLRAQSAYGFSNIPGASNTTAASAIFTPSVAPLRVRSKSSERLNSSYSTSGMGDGMVSALSAGPGTTKFVDPLVLRRQSKEALSKPIAMPKPVGKIPVGQLVAFFDGDKK